MKDRTKPSYEASAHAGPALGAMQEGLGQYVAQQMDIAFKHGCERGRDDAEAEHRKELKAALELREREVRADAASKQIASCPKCSAAPAELQQALEKLIKAFNGAVSAAFEGWSEAQDGHSYDCAETRDSLLKPAQEKFDEAMKVIDPSYVAPVRKRR